MTSKEKLIKVYEEMIKSLSYDELKKFYDDNDLQDEYEKILFSMPKKVEMETFRVSLISHLLGWIDFDSLSEDELIELVNNLIDQKKEK